MKKFISVFVCFFIFSAISSSQNIWELGGEYQHSFGKGVSDNTLGLRYEGFKTKSSWSFGITYTLPGKGESENKGGFGFYGGYRYGFSYSGNANGNGGNGFIGFRASFNFNGYEHGNKKGNDATITPTVETGYQFIFSTHGFFTPGIGYGYSIKLNQDNDAPKTDEGSRFIPTVGIGYRF